MIGYAKYALIGFGALMFLFFMRRSIRRREKETFTGQPTWLRELETPRPLAALVSGDESADRGQAPAVPGQRTQAPGRGAGRTRPRSRRPAGARLDERGLVVSRRWPPNWKRHPPAPPPLPRPRRAGAAQAQARDQGPQEGGRAARLARPRPRRRGVQAPARRRDRDAVAGDGQAAARRPGHRRPPCSRSSRRPSRPTTRCSPAASTTRARCSSARSVPSGRSRSSGGSRA